MAERDYWNHPGGNACFWNTPIGSGATWSVDGNLDQRDLRAERAIINPPGNYGCCIWVSRSASDPSATFIPYSSADFERGVGKDGKFNGRGIMQDTVTTMRAPLHAFTPGAAPGGTPVDGQFVVFDTTTPANVGKVYHFAPLQISDFTGGVTYKYNLQQTPNIDMYYGGVEDALSDKFATDAETGNANFTQAAGVIRGYDLDPNQNPARLPAPYSHLTKIQHVLRYMIDGLYLKENMTLSTSAGPVNSHLKPDSWPQYYHDWQGDILYNRYRGQLIYGSTVGIPSSVTMPTNLSDPGKQLWYALQRYGSVTRDQAGGGFHVSADHTVPEMWRAQAEADLSNIIRSHLRVMRNQHQTGQSFTTYPMNGPGTRLDEGPPLLRGTTPVTPPVITPSPNGTVVLSGETRAITDAAGNKWTLPASQVVLNGVTDTTTSSVTKLAYVNGVVWHRNTSGLWYGKSSPTASWSPGNGTTVDPTTGVTPPTESADGTVVLSGATGVITDSTGNSWTLPGTQVVLNGVPDTSTSSVTKLLYYKDVVWHQNTSGRWYGKTSVTAAWSPSGGTLVHPMQSPDKTVVLAGSGGVITDAAGNLWTLNSSQYVNVNGSPISSVATVRIAYVSGVVWVLIQSSSLWYGTTSPTGPWTPSAGTAVDPITGVAPVTPSASGTTLLAGSSGVITDASGNQWTLPSTKIITVNGVAISDPTSLKLAYVSGVVWTLVTLGLWYGTTLPSGPWSPAGGATTPPITITPSANNTTVLAGASGVITDATGNEWTLSSAGVVILNGAPDTTTSGMSRITYSNGVVWSQYGTGNWWGKVSPNSAWLPPAGAATLPVESSSGTVVLAGASGAITDKAGNAWTLPSTQIVSINGTPDTTSSLITRIVYDVGIVWALNTLGAWYGKASPGDGWEPQPNGTSINPLTGAPASATGTVVRAGSTGVITDAFSNTWTLPSTKIVSINGTPDTSSSGITKIIYVNGVVWGLNTSGLWYGKDSSTGTWDPSAGTATPPLPIAAPASGTTVRAGTTGVITDEGGSEWTLSGNQVAINGVVDTTTSGITKLVFVNGTVWCMHTSGLWWGRASPSAAWLPSAGTTTPPLTIAVPPDGTTVLAGGTGIITDAGGNDWTISSAGVVAVNGVPDTSTSGMSRIVYVSANVWCQYGSGLWWGRASPSAAWLPSAGTSTAPI